jgi:protein TonB
MMQTGIFEERDRWTGALVLSAGLHLLLAIAVIVAGYIRAPHGENWGGSSSGEAVQANLVSAVPLPAPQTPTQNILANESKGLTQSVPEKVQEEAKAIPIPEKDARRKPQKTAVTQAPEKPRPVAPPQNNTVPYGQGGPVNGPYGAFTASHIQGGFSFEGDFGSRFAWYVQVVKNKVANNWYTVEVSPNAVGHRAFVSFDIGKDGAPGNVRLEQSSGIPALDQSAIRVLQRIDGFGPLPPGYSGSYLHVELWFNYQG